MAALSPSWASEMTSLTPESPRLTRSRRKSVPEHLGLGRADVKPDDLAPALGVHGHRDYGGDRHDAAALAHLEVGGVESEIGPLTGKRALEKGANALIDLPAQLGHRRLRDAR